MDALANWFDAWVTRAGLPLAVFAWFFVVAAVIAMTAYLSSHGRRDLWKPGLVVGGLSALGYGTDISVTLWVAPDLALEGNRMWLAIVNGFGLQVAIAYGLTAQFCVILLSGQLYAWYRLVRERLWPAKASSLVAFVRGLGGQSSRKFGVAIEPLLVLGAFSFALLGPFFAYIAWRNAFVVSDVARHAGMLRPLPAALIWLMLVFAGFFAGNWRDYRKRRLVAQRDSNNFSNSP